MTVAWLLTAADLADDVIVIQAHIEAVGAVVEGDGVAGADHPHGGRPTLGANGLPQRLAVLAPHAVLDLGGAALGAGLHPGRRGRRFMSRRGNHSGAAGQQQARDDGGEQLEGHDCLLFLDEKSRSESTRSGLWQGLSDHHWVERWIASPPRSMSSPAPRMVLQPESNERVKSDSSTMAMVRFIGVPPCQWIRNTLTQSSTAASALPR